jgi:hypothetical protein
MRQNMQVICLGFGLKQCHIPVVIEKKGKKQNKKPFYLEE